MIFISEKGNGKVLQNLLPLEKIFCPDGKLDGSMEGGPDEIWDGGGMSGGGEPEESVEALIEAGTD